MIFEVLLDLLEGGGEPILCPEPSRVSAGGQVTSTHRPVSWHSPDHWSSSQPSMSPSRAVGCLALGEAENLRSGLMKVEVRKGLAIPGGRSEGIPRRGGRS